MKKAICLFIIGEKYKKIYLKNRVHFLDYANKCNANLIILDRPIDESFHRNILSQKLLIPSVLIDYDVVLFLDLDILISDVAPSIFDYLPVDKCFGAVLDPRNTDEFNKTWQHIPRILEETDKSYFTDRNFKQNPLLKGSINGGVFIFRPKIVFDVFKDYYYSNHNQGELNSFEETPFAYFSQIYDWFEPLPLKFNAQVLYKVKGTEKGRIVEREEQKIWKFFRKLYYKKTGNCFYPTSNYKEFVKDIMKNNYFIHFSGKYPIIYR